MIDFHIVIPARYESSRLPGKALMDIQGKPMLQHVYERALHSGAKSVLIATDDQRIEEAANAFTDQVMMTSAAHPTGTDRLAEVLTRGDYNDHDIVVNVQGDEPMIPPGNINQVAMDLAAHPEAQVSTLYQPIDTLEKVFDPNVVKIVMDKAGYALYFSRAPIPWHRGVFGKSGQETVSLATDYCWHIGLYAYRVDFVKDYVTKSAAPMEKVESLEQLRVLWHGGKIHVTQAQEKCPQDVNTLEDLEALRQKLR